MLKRLEPSNLKMAQERPVRPVSSMPEIVMGSDPAIGFGTLLCHASLPKTWGSD